MSHKRQVFALLLGISSVSCVSPKKSAATVPLDMSRSESSEEPAKVAKFLASFTPYLPQQNAKTYELPPKGCKAAHISGIFRHGSRYLASDDQFSLLLKFLELAKSENTLSDKGAKVLQWVHEIQKEFKAGQLTDQGRGQLFGIGKRMSENFEELFASSKGKIDFIATYVSRARESRDQFKKGFLSSGKIETARTETRDNEKCNDLGLRYFDSCQRYYNYLPEGGKIAKHEGVKDVNMEEAKQSRDRDLAELFSPAMLQNHAFQEEAWGITSSIFRLCQQDNAINYKVGTQSFCSLLSPEILNLESRKMSLSTYYKLGPIAKVQDQQYQKVTYNMSCMALEPIFSEIEKVVNQENTGTAFLRFAHAETVVPLSAFLQLFDEDENKWQAAEAAPMASNLQIITYECSDNGQKSYKLKQLYNEKEHHFPIRECQNSYFCDWDLVKSYYAARKAETGIPSCSLHEWNSYCGNATLDTVSCAMKKKDKDKHKKKGLKLFDEDKHEEDEF